MSVNEESDDMIIKEHSGYTLLETTRSNYSFRFSSLLTIDVQVSALKIVYSFERILRIKSVH